MHDQGADRPMDKWTNGQTNKPSWKDARCENVVSHLPPYLIPIRAKNNNTVDCHKGEPISREIITIETLYYKWVASKPAWLLEGKTCFSACTRGGTVDLVGKSYWCLKQVEQSSDYRCVLACTCTSTCTDNCIFTCSFVLLLLKCYLDCLIITFHALNYL